MTIKKTIAKRSEELRKKNHVHVGIEFQGRKKGFGCIVCKILFKTRPETGWMTNGISMAAPVESDWPNPPPKNEKAHLAAGPSGAGAKGVARTGKPKVEAPPEPVKRQVVRLTDLDGTAMNAALLSLLLSRAPERITARGAIEYLCQVDILPRSRTVLRGPNVRRRVRRNLDGLVGLQMYVGTVRKRELAGGPVGVESVWWFESRQLAEAIAAGTVDADPPSEPLPFTQGGRR